MVAKCWCLASIGTGQMRVWGERGTEKNDNERYQHTAGTWNYLSATRTSLHLASGILLHSNHGCVENRPSLISKSENISLSILGGCIVLSEVRLSQRLFQNLFYNSLSRVLLIQHIYCSLGVSMSFFSGDGLRWTKSDQIQAKTISKGNITHVRYKPVGKPVFLYMLPCNSMQNIRW